MPFFRFIICLTLLFSALSHSSFSQETPGQAQVQPPGTGLWLGLYTKLRLSDKVYYYAETHYRRQNSLDNRWDFAGRMWKIYNRHGINYLFNKYFEVTAGPVVVLGFTPDPGNPDYQRMVPEYRFWHQYLLIQPQIGRVKLYHQFRFEHRFRRSNLIGADYQYTNRYRYKILAYIPLNKPYLVEKTVYLAPSVEIFLHSGPSIVYNPLEDFRIYPVIGYIIDKNYMVSAGYTWTFGQAGTGFEYKQMHLVRLNLYVNFDLRSPRKAIPEVHMDY